MAKGNPNDASMKLNFVAKIWDKEAQTYRPIYIAPDATDAVRGDVYLSDAIDSEDNAKTGVTAATPKAVKNVYDTLVKNKAIYVGTEEPQDKNVILWINPEGEGSDGESLTNMFNKALEELKKEFVRKEDMVAIDEEKIKIWQGEK